MTVAGVYVDNIALQFIRVILAIRSSITPKQVLKILQCSPGLGGGELCRSLSAEFLLIHGNAQYRLYSTVPALRIESVCQHQE